MNHLSDMSTVTTSSEPRIAKNTRTRIISTFLLLPLIVYALYTGGIAFTLLSIVFFAIGALELTTIILNGKVGRMTAACTSWVVATILSFAYGEIGLWLGIVLVGGFTIAVSSLTTGLTVIRTLVLLTLLMFIAHVAGFGVVIRNRPDGVLWWLLIMLATFTSDTLAYAGGRAYGKTPLLPSWSPKKTREGTITGVVGAAIIGLVSLWYYHLGSFAMYVTVIFAPFAAVAGDLLESKLKRTYHVKDSSVKGFNIVPGHGGILDRLDSLSLVIVFVYLVLQFV